MSGGGSSNYTPPPTGTPWIYKTDLAGNSLSGGASQDSTSTNPYGYWSGAGTKTPTSSDLQSFADGGMALTNPMSGYASPNQGFMQYQGQGQPNQPPVLSNALPTTQFMGGPDSGADYASANLGFDGSGSDGGVGGQPAPMATPLAQGNKPLGLAQFQQPQGLQIAGNPTSQIVQRPQQR